MDFYPIELGVTRAASLARKTQNRAVINSGSVSPSGKHLDNELKQKIFERDEFSCVCCGFNSLKYQQILFKDGDFFNIKESNLATACIFCHQCFHIDTVNDMKSGVLLWLPEVPQWQLHHMARAIYVARISQGPIADAARNVLDILMSRRTEAVARITTDDPYILATVMKDYLLPGHYKMRGKKLEGIRLFPLDRRLIKEAELEFNQFPQILAYWRSKNGPFAGRAPTEWISLYQDTMAQAA